MNMTTHQDIFNALCENEEESARNTKSVYAMYDEVIRGIEKERVGRVAQLQEDCGKLGHLYKPGSPSTGDPLDQRDQCVICGACAPVSAQMDGIVAFSTVVRNNEKMDDLVRAHKEGIAKMLLAGVSPTVVPNLSAKFKLFEKP